jgi:hypothetical protein
LGQGSSLRRQLQGKVPNVLIGAIGVKDDLASFGVSKIAFELNDAAVLFAKLNQHGKIKN